MEKLNNYKKVQIVLLVLIVIALIVFIVSAKKTKDVKNYLSTEVSSDKLVEETQNELIGETIPEEVIDDNSWDEQVEESSEVDLTEEENAEENNSSKYYIKINYTANVVTIYTKDSSGKYTVPIKALVCSTGTATPTSGVYKMGQKYRWHTLNGGVKGQYCTRITGHILFHSVPYSSQSPDSLKYTAYDKLGTKASAGCIRLTVEGALWIYNNCPSGTYVEFYSSSNPGPLGKPTAQKISWNETCRNWDPTDPDPRNPWKNYVQPASSTQVTEEPKQENNQENHQENNQENELPKQEEIHTPEPEQPKQEENQTEEETEQKPVDNNTSSTEADEDDSEKQNKTNNTTEEKP